jgi:hypothetical protein
MSKHTVVAYDHDNNVVSMRTNLDNKEVEIWANKVMETRLYVTSVRAFYPSGSQWFSAYRSSAENRKESRFFLREELESKINELVELRNKISLNNDGEASEHLFTASQSLLNALYALNRADNE